ncbi:disintegrin and metalloproteinase domain-containing protein 23-like isoform X4 [Arapaima gigas]
MYLIFLPNLLASILVSGLSLVGLTAAVPTAAGNESASDAVTAAASGSDSVRRREPPIPPQHEITYPSRLIYYLNEDSESTYHNLDTRTRSQDDESQVVHLAQASFQLEAFGSRFILDLTLNKALSDMAQFLYFMLSPCLVHQTPLSIPSGWLNVCPSATNLIIGSIAGAILVAAIVLGGTGWGFKVRVYAEWQEKPYLQLVGAAFKPWLTAPPWMTGLRPLCRAGPPDWPASCHCCLPHRPGSHSTGRNVKKRRYDPNASAI